MKNSIDVLVLSATPIPRTLQMSLIGVRTISQLNTPPAQRHPIQTYVMERKAVSSKKSFKENYLVEARFSIYIIVFLIFILLLKICRQILKM